MVSTRYDWDQPRSLRPEGGKWGCNKLSFGVRRRAMEPRPVRRDCENAFEEIVSSCDVPHSMTVTVPSSMWGRICKILVVNGNVSARRLLRARNTTIFSRCLARFCWKLMLLSIVMSTSKPVSLAFSSNTPLWIPAHPSRWTDSTSCRPSLYLSASLNFHPTECAFTAAP